MMEDKVVRGVTLMKVYHRLYANPFRGVSSADDMIAIVRELHQTAGIADNIERIRLVSTEPSHRLGSTYPAYDFEIRYHKRLPDGRIDRQHVLFEVIG